MRLRLSFWANAGILGSTLLISTTSVSLIFSKPTCMTFNWKTLKTMITLHQMLMMTHGDAGAQVDEDNSTELLASLTKQQGSTHPGHLANVLSTARTKHEKGVKFINKLNAGPSPPPKDDEIVVNGKRYSRSSTSHLLLCLLPPAYFTPTTVHHQARKILVWCFPSATDNFH